MSTTKNIDEIIVRLTFFISDRIKAIRRAPLDPDFIRLITNKEIEKLLITELKA